MILCNNRKGHSLSRSYVHLSNTIQYNTTQTQYDIIRYIMEQYVTSIQTKVKDNADTCILSNYWYVILCNDRKWYSLSKSRFARLILSHFLISTMKCNLKFVEWQIAFWAKKVVNKSIKECHINVLKTQKRTKYHKSYILDLVLHSYKQMVRSLSKFGKYTYPHIKLNYLTLAIRT